MDLVTPEQEACAVLTRISQQGMNQAAKVLSDLLRLPVRIDVADGWMFDCELIAAQQKNKQVGIFMTIDGDINGGLLLAFSDECAVWLSQILLRTTTVPDLLCEPTSSTLKEVGNIFASTFLASLDDQLGLRALPSPPQLEVNAIANQLKRCCRADNNSCMVLRTTLTGITESLLQGTIYLSLEADGFSRLLTLSSGGH